MPKQNGRGPAQHLKSFIWLYAIMWSKAMGQKPSNRYIDNFRVLIVIKSSKIDKLCLWSEEVGHKPQVLIGYHYY